MSNQEFVEILYKRIELYYRILKESWWDTTEYTKNKKERERQRYYHEKVDHFLGLKN